MHPFRENSISSGEGCLDARHFGAFVNSYKRDASDLTGRHGVANGDMVATEGARHRPIVIGKGPAMAGDDQTWKILHSRSLIRDRHIDVRMDACETPSGLRVDPYYVLTYPDWVVVVAITPDRQMVLVRQYRHGAGKVLLEAPAGSIEPSDEDPEAAARRELLEETGYRCEQMEWLSSLYPNPSMQTNKVHAFLARDVIRVGDQQLDPEEDGMTVELLPIETVLAGLGTGLIGQSMHVAAILQAMTVLPVVKPAPSQPATLRAGET
ncbi:NUDIX hydrolase [Rhizobium sp. NFR03]|uniref:NUDIX hydrolase n=1 Tax=Rhizobium sp. NFR03 TaxID=1566263 RepID=UPI001FCD8EA0|nr:NUDIX hydrolase [Rhizobium sp. NFR03]